MSSVDFNIIGGGLSGCEAAWQLARRGNSVRLFEMRPIQSTPAHRTDRLAELVCSNSLKSMAPNSATYLLQEELRQLRSLLIRVADECRVPAGQALAVDRTLFSRKITEIISSNPAIQLVRKEITEIPDSGITIIASGPLTSESFSQAISRWAGQDHLYFYDAISPIVAADSLDSSVVFSASRYGKGGEDYLNCPMTPEEYKCFYEALIAATTVPMRDFEKPLYFEACLPLEELARRGKETLLFGPFKPVGLKDPRSGKRPYAVLQLRRENLLADAYNLVGCQNHLTFGEQQRIFRCIPGMGKAEFLRFGRIHRNTYIDSPRLLRSTLQSRKNEHLFFAGQICGIEGYLEAIATGLIAGVQASCLAQGETPWSFPPDTACGSLCRYIAETDTPFFQPMNMTFGLLPLQEETPGYRIHDKQERRRKQIQHALSRLDDFINRYPPLQDYRH